MNNFSLRWPINEFWHGFIRKRQREQEIKEEESAKKKKEWDKNWEVSQNSDKVSEAQVYVYIMYLSTAPVSAGYILGELWNNLISEYFWK
jgi:hypothetical protein